MVSVDGIEIEVVDHHEGAVGFFDLHTDILPDFAPYGSGVKVLREAGGVRMLGVLGITADAE